MPTIDSHVPILDIKESQNQDPIIKTIIECVKSKDSPKWEEIAHLGQAHKYYWVRYNSLKFLNGILYHIWEGVQPKYQIVLPQSLKHLIFQQLHNSVTGGHLGVRKTLSKIKDRYFWYHMSQDTQNLL